MFLSLKKVLISLCLFGFIFLASYVLYLWMTYIDEKITSGTAYGFTIGDSKSETYQNASGMLPNLDVGNSPIFIEVKVDEANSILLGTSEGYTVMTQTLLHEVGFPAFNEKNKWEFYFNGTYFDSLSLRFCDNKLCEIYRHRKNFELP